MTLTSSCVQKWRSTHKDHGLPRASAEIEQDVAGTSQALVNNSKIEIRSGYKKFKALDENLNIGPLIHVATQNPVH